MTSTIRDKNVKMQAAIHKGLKKVKMEEVDIPSAPDDKGAIIKITAASLCGTDLDLYIEHLNLEGYVVGHEAIGIVDDIGKEVNKVKKGDRVLISPIISCGSCDFCSKEEWSCCEITNECKEKEECCGYKSGAAILSLGHFFGFYNGVQAEFAKISFADVNLFKIPDEINDKQAVALIDSACAAYHACELASIKEGDNVVIFGCGSLGLMTTMWALYRKAKFVIVIDIDPNRLQFAKKTFTDKIHTINSSKCNPVKAVRALLPDGPNKVIDCVGFHYSESLMDKIDFTFAVEKSATHIINHSIDLIANNGVIAVVGTYKGYCDHFNIGTFLQKNLTMSGGIFWPHKYYNKIFDIVKKGEVDPSFIITHMFPLSLTPDAYINFAEHRDSMIKPMLIPDKLYKLEPK